MYGNIAFWYLKSEYWIILKIATPITSGEAYSHEP